MLLYSNLRDYRVSKDSPRPGSPRKQRPRSGRPTMISDPAMHARRQLRGGLYPFNPPGKKKEQEEEQEDHNMMIKLPVRRSSVGDTPLDNLRREASHRAADLKALQERVVTLRSELVAAADAVAPITPRNPRPGGGPEVEAEHDPAQPRGDVDCLKEHDCDVLVVHSDSGDACARHLGQLLGPKFPAMRVYPGEEEVNQTLLLVEQLVASTRRSLVVVISEGCLQSNLCILAMRAAHVYSVPVLLVHDITSCPMPSYEQQPADLQDVFGVPAVPFLSTYAEYDAWQVASRVAPEADMDSVRNSELDDDDDDPRQAGGLGAAPSVRMRAKKMNTMQRRNANMTRKLDKAIGSAPMILTMLRRPLAFRAFVSYRRATAQGPIGRITQALQDEYRMFADVAMGPKQTAQLIEASHTILVFLSKGYVDSEDCVRELTVAAHFKRRAVVVHDLSFTLPVAFAEGDAFRQAGGPNGPAAQMLREGWARRIPYHAEQLDAVVQALRWEIGLGDSLAHHMLQLLRSNLSSRVGKPMLIDVILGGMNMLEEELEDELTLQEQLHLRAGDAACIGALVSRSSCLVRVDLSASHLSDHGVRKLAWALKYNHVVQVLVLREGNVGAEGAQALGEALRHNNTLWSLDLSSNHIRSDGARALAESLGCNRVVREIRLKSNEIGPDGALALGDALRVNESIESLDLACNNLGSEGGGYLGESLAQNSALLRLELRENGLGAAGGVALSSMLRANQTLRYLGLKNNKLDIDGALAIADALRENRGLEQLVLCWNHVEDMGARAIFEAIRDVQHPTLTSLDVSVNGIRNGSLEALAGALKTPGVGLVHVDLSYNEVSDPGAKLLSDAVLTTSWTLPNFRELDLRHNWVGIDERWASRDKLKTCGFGEAPGSAMCWQRKESYAGPRAPSPGGAAAVAAAASDEVALAPFGGSGLPDADPFGEGTRVVSAEEKASRQIVQMERVVRNLGEDLAAAELEISSLERALEGTGAGTWPRPTSSIQAPEEISDVAEGDHCDVMVCFHPTFGLTCAQVLKRLMDQSPAYGDVRLLCGPAEGHAAPPGYGLDSVPRRVAGAGKVLVCVLSFGTLSDDYQMLALRSAEVSGRRICIVHDVESCPFPGYMAQPEDLRDVFAAKPVPFVAQYGGQLVVDHISAVIATALAAEAERAKRASEGESLAAAAADASFRGGSQEMVLPPPGGADGSRRESSDSIADSEGGAEGGGGKALEPSRAYVSFTVACKDQAQALQIGISAEYRMLRRPTRSVRRAAAVVDPVARVKSCSTFVAFLSKGYLEDPECVAELGAAVKLGKNIVVMHDYAYELPARLHSNLLADAAPAETADRLREAWESSRVTFHWGHIEPAVQSLRWRIGLADDLAARLETVLVRGKMRIPALAPKLRRDMPNLEGLLGRELSLQDQEMSDPELVSLGALLHTNRSLRRLDLRGVKVGAARRGVQSIAGALLFNRTLTALELRDCQLGTKGVQELSEALKYNFGCSLSCLDIRGNGIGVIGIRSLVEALVGNRNLPLETLDLSDNRVGDEGLAVVGQALRSKQSKLLTLRMGKNEIGPEGARAFKDSLIQNRTLTHLDLCDNALCDDGAAALAVAIERDTSLAFLGLSTNGISAQGAEALASALEKNTRLHSLDLHWNEVGPVGAAAMADGLVYNATLEELDMSVNAIGSAGAAAMAGAVVDNSSLRRLELHWNGMGATGARAIADALVSNTSLTQLGLSSNKVKAEGAQALGAALLQNKHMQVLALRGNDLESAGVWAVADALKEEGCSVHTLYLQANAVTRDGAKGLAEALKSNTSLRILALSNNRVMGEGARSLAEGLKENSTLELIDIQANGLTGAEEEQMTKSLAEQGFKHQGECQWARGSEAASPRKRPTTARGVGQGRYETPR